MRPWRLIVVGADGGVPSWRALCVRYAVGTVSLLAAGLGFWWAWVDRDRLAWHDRASGTRMLRKPKSPSERPMGANASAGKSIAPTGRSSQTPGLTPSCAGTARPRPPATQPADYRKQRH